MFISQAFAETANLSNEPNILTTIIPFILVFLIFYFLVIRPQNKKMQVHKDKISSVKRGDDIVTNGGIIGKVSHIREDLIEVDIAPNVRIKIKKDAILNIITKEDKITKNKA